MKKILEIFKDKKQLGNLLMVLGILMVIIPTLWFLFWLNIAIGIFASGVIIAFFGAGLAGKFNEDWEDL